MGDIKLEAGQRWDTRHRTLGPLVLITRSDPACWSMRNRLAEVACFNEAWLRSCCTLIAPAPVAGQQWRLRNGMVTMLTAYSDKLCCATSRTATGYVSGILLPPVELAIWLFEQGAEYVGSDGWRQATPSQFHHFRALAEAVTAVCTRSTVAETRRLIDVACHELHGQPFADAIRAVLVSCSDNALSAVQIAGVIAGCRAWEEERARWLPGRGTLIVDRNIACDRRAIAAAFSAGGFWLSTAGAVYERARAACSG